MVSVFAVTLIICNVNVLALEMQNGKNSNSIKNVESGKVYYYKIRCRSAYGESYKYGEYSNKISCRVS